MAVETMTSPRSNLPNTYTNVTAREIDFVSRFSNNWDALREIIGISRPIRKSPGTQLVSYKASVELAESDGGNGMVSPGAVIPYSKWSLEKVDTEPINIMKFAKAVTIEEVNQYGAALAVQKSDEAFLYQLQNMIMHGFYHSLGFMTSRIGSNTQYCNDFQQCLAKAKGKLIDNYNKLGKTLTEVVAFANVMDFYDYLGNANIETQTEFGLTYIKNFMGYSRIFLLSDPDIAKGDVIAVPVENINLYYIDPSDSEFAQLGLDYTVQGETNLIGFHANGNYSTAVGESFAIIGMTLWAELYEGVVKATTKQQNT